MSKERTNGMTLIEALIALAILGVVLSLAYGAITSSLRVQSQQEANVTAQAKLRRIIEVISQDLRSAVFGSITDNPYGSDSTQVSFMMLTGGAGYPVMETANFSNQNWFEVLATETSGLVGNQVVIVNSEGQGVVLPVTAVTSGASAASRRVSHSCTNTIDFGTSVLMFQIETTGISFDDSENGMFIQTTSVADEQPFAFDVSDVRFDYVYTFTEPAEGFTGSPTDTVRVHDEPVRGSHGYPVRTFQDSGFIFTLSRLQVVVETIAEVNGRQSTHAYSGQVDLSRAAHFKVEEILPCS